MKFLFWFLILLGSLGASNVNVNPRLAVNGAGNATVWWEAWNGHNKIIQKASRPSGGDWEAPVSVFSLGVDSHDSNVSMNGSGQIIAVWQQGISTVASDITTFGGADSLKAISPTEQGLLFLPSIGIDGAGNGVAVWQREVGGKYFVVSSTYLSSSSQWGTPFVLNKTNPSLIFPTPRIAVNSGGRAVAVWQQLNTGVLDSFIQAAFLIGGSWTFPVVLSASLESARNPQVAINSSNNAIVVWHESRGSVTAVVARACNSDGDWEEPKTLSSLDMSAVNGQIALNDNGKAVAVWQQATSSGRYLIQAAVFSGSWEDPAADLSNASIDAASPQVTLNAAGEAIASWRAKDMNGNYLIQTAFLSTGGSWGSVDTISDSSLQSQNNQVRFDTARNAVATWEAISNSAGTSVIQANFRPVGSVWETAQTVSLPIP